MIFRTARRIAVGIVGTGVLVVGVALLVLPGPAFVVIPAGLGILALEFAWAQRWLERAKEHGKRVAGSVRNGRTPRRSIARHRW